ncbi:hypothetical protein E2C01_063176 [Portunus trituberculatus]|uniref:Uncharacterized protein n=1 Tax=Portunus trituberculatus TaxID=210409 RepID=A0A5B7HFN1_PORTR|nr:hypothetical protein [Portunus trituberculatus]
MIRYALHFPYVISSTTYVHASTKSPECRSAILKHRRHNPQDQQQEQDCGGGLPQTAVDRLALPPWRQFTPAQVTAICSHQQGHYHLDNTSTFSIRPPELLLFFTLEVYLRWLTWKKEPKAQLNPILNASHLIDGAGRCVRICAAHGSHAASYIHALTTCNDPTVAVIATDLYAHIFGPIHHHQQKEAPATEHYQRFVDTTDMRRNVVVFKAPFPSNLPEFFVHTLQY